MRTISRPSHTARPSSEACSRRPCPDCRGRARDPLRHRADHDHLLGGRGGGCGGGGALGDQDDLTQGAGVQGLAWPARDPVLLRPGRWPGRPVKGSSFFIWFLVSSCVPFIGLLTALLRWDSRAAATVPAAGASSSSTTPCAPLRGGARVPRRGARPGSGARQVGSPRHEPRPRSRTDGRDRPR